MLVRRAAVILLLYVALAAVLSVPVHGAYSLGFLSTRGLAIVDPTGREVLLQGVNYPGYAQGRPQPHNAYSYWTLEGFRFNVVRLPISWANLEPQPGVFDTTYLSSYVDQDVRWASSFGVYIILDMHQIDWAERFGGYGAPDWTVRKYMPNATGMQEAVSDFWSDKSLQEHLIQVWVRIAQHFANEPSVAGYDLLNEPWIYIYSKPGVNSSAVGSFYSRAIEAIRSVDPNHIIFLEPANINSFKLPKASNIVWSPHFYQFSFANKYYIENFTVLENDFLAKYRAFAVDSGTPIWFGEFGAFMRDEPSRVTWIENAMTLFHRYHVGWAWWAYDGTWTSIPDAIYV